jgi:hypothetical protein
VGDNWIKFAIDQPSPKDFAVIFDAEPNKLNQNICRGVMVKAFHFL